MVHKYKASIIKLLITAGMSSKKEHSMKQSYSSVQKSCLCLYWENSSTVVAGKGSFANSIELLNSSQNLKCWEKLFKTRI